MLRAESDRVRARRRGDSEPGVEEAVWFAAHAAPRAGYRSRGWSSTASTTTGSVDAERLRTSRGPRSPSPLGHGDSPDRVIGDVRRLPPASPAADRPQPRRGLDDVSSAQGRSEGLRRSSRCRCSTGDVHDVAGLAPRAGVPVRRRRRARATDRRTSSPDGRSSAGLPGHRRPQPQRTRRRGRRPTSAQLSTTSCQRSGATGLPRSESSSSSRWLVQHLPDRPARRATSCSEARQLRIGRPRRARPRRRTPGRRSAGGLGEHVLERLDLGGGPARTAVNLGRAPSR